jgi:DNA-binding transcriptional LysR family regulator
MKDVDLNLLVALDALLAEISVTRAARRLGLSASAMSRTLARLREATGDPLLVRAGRVLVLTPHAAALRESAHGLVREARNVLRPAPGKLDLASVDQTVSIRVSQGFMESLATALTAAVMTAAPGLRLRFAPKPDKDAGPIRDGTIDLEIGVLGTAAPEMRVQTLFRDSYVGVVRSGHPLLLDGPITPERYAACSHVVASRKGRIDGPVDDALRALGLKRTIAVVVPGYPDAVRMARGSNLVALVPSLCVGFSAGEQGRAFDGVEAFELPVGTPDIAVSAVWHPRLDSDPLHRWLRQTVSAVCRTINGGNGPSFPKS